MRKRTGCAVPSGTNGPKHARTPERILPATSADQGGRSNAESTEAADFAVRNRDHRALPEAGKFGGRSTCGDVSCWRERTTRRRHYRSLVGNAGQPEHGERAESEDLCAD